MLAFCYLYSRGLLDSTTISGLALVPELRDQTVSYWVRPCQKQSVLNAISSKLHFGKMMKNANCDKTDLKTEASWWSLLMPSQILGSFPSSLFHPTFWSDPVPREIGRAISLHLRHPNGTLFPQWPRPPTENATRIPPSKRLPSGCLFHTTRLEPGWHDAVWKCSDTWTSNLSNTMQNCL